jgi:hypothetical protein
MNFQKEMMRVFAEIQNEMGKSMKEYVEKFGSNVARGATAPLKSVQDRTTEAVFNPLTGMFSLWESAFREVATMTNKNISAASAGVQRAAEDAMHTTVRVTEASVDAASDVTAAAMPEAMSSERKSAASQAHATTSSNGSNGSSVGNGSNSGMASERQSERQAERPAERQTERQAERQATRQEVTEVHDERRPHASSPGRRK